MLNKFGSDFEKPTSMAIAWVIPLSAPVVLFLTESYLIPVAFLMPLALVILLSYLALKLPPSAVLFWMSVYILFVILVRYVSPEPPAMVSALRPYVRSGFIIAGGVTAFLLAVNRTRMRKSNQALFKIVSVLPSAVIVSDISGNILLMNKACDELLRGYLDPLRSLSFFATFIERENQGREIEKYLGYFKTDEGGPFSSTLHTRGERSLILDVVITIVTLEKARYAVTVIERSVEASVPKVSTVATVTPDVARL